MSEKDKPKVFSNGSLERSINTILRHYKDQGKINIKFTDNPRVNSITTVGMTFKYNKRLYFDNDLSLLLEKVQQVFPKHDHITEAPVKEAHL